MIPEEGLASHGDAANSDFKWDQVITADKSLLKLDFPEIWRYRDLLALFVKRDVVTIYKQTILGPLWFVIQPLLTSFVFAFVFGNLAGISTGGVPNLLFYLCGIIIWNYFSETLNITSRTFTENAGIFGKVYFPRLILPLSKVVSGLFRFLVQLGMFLVIWAYYVFITKTVAPNAWLFIIPFLLLLMAGMGLGCGIIVTSLTTKYRDLSFLIVFGVQLLMYASPVIYPVSSISDKYQLLLWLNPLTSVLEAFKYAFLGSGTLSVGWLMYSTLFTTIILIFGVLIFNKVENRFIDTV